MRPPLLSPRRIAIQHSKMFRFLNAFILQTCKFTPQNLLKIGTFSVGGGQKRREWGPGRVVLRAANQNRSLAGGKRTLVSTRVERELGLAPLSRFLWLLSCAGTRK